MRHAPSLDAARPAIRIAAPVVSKLAVAAGLEVPGIQDAEDVFLGAGFGEAPPTLYLRFSATPGADLSLLRQILATRVREKVQTFAGVDLGAVEVEVVQGLWPAGCAASHA